MLKNPILFGWWEIEGKERELAISSLTLLGDALFFSFFPAISQPSGQYFFFFVLHFLNTQMQDWEFQIHVEFCFHGVPCLISLLICFSLLLITFVIA